MVCCCNFYYVHDFSYSHALKLQYVDGVFSFFHPHNFYNIAIVNLRSTPINYVPSPSNVFLFLNDNIFETISGYYHEKYSSADLNNLLISDSVRLYVTYFRGDVYVEIHHSSIIFKHRKKFKVTPQDIQKLISRVFGSNFKLK
ncbi:hypothetical protein [Sulfurimonas sp.]